MSRKFKLDFKTFKQHFMIIEDDEIFRNIIKIMDESGSIRECLIFESVLYTLLCVNC